MKAVAKQEMGYVLMGATALAYFSRPLSCGVVLSRFTPDDQVPYSNFDYHGWGVMFAWLLALLFAAPILWLASKVYMSGGTTFRLFGRADDAKTTIASVLIALGIGAPMHSQLAYLYALPTGIAAPVLVSSFSWLLVVELGRTAAVDGRLLDKRTVCIAAGLALLIAVPKLALLGYALSHA